LPGKLAERCGLAAWRSSVRTKSAEATAAELPPRIMQTALNCAVLKGAVVGHFRDADDEEKAT
jgi:hypothetical protein